MVYSLIDLIIDRLLCLVGLGGVPALSSRRLWIFILCPRQIRNDPRNPGCRCSRSGGVFLHPLLTPHGGGIRVVLLFCPLDLLKIEGAGDTHNDLTWTDCALQHTLDPLLKGFLKVSLILCLIIAQVRPMGVF